MILFARGRGLTDELGCQICKKSSVQRLARESAHW